MRSFVIEVYWPDMTASLAADLAERARGAAAGTASSVRYVSCTMTPRDETCFLRVEARAEAAVDALVALLALPSARVSELVDVSVSSGSAVRPGSRG